MRDMNIYRKIKKLAESDSDRILYTAVDCDMRKNPLTAGELFEECRSIAAGIQKRISEKEARCLLVFKQDIEMIKAFFSVNFASCIPVPYSFPKNESNVRNIISVMENCGADVILTNTYMQETLKDLFAEYPYVKILTVDELRENAELFEERFCDIQILQYTSGSTGNPKGVMITSDSLLANIEAFSSLAVTDRENVIVTWLPYNHDMFLVHDLIGNLYLNSSLVFMKPEDFFSRPLSLAELITKYHATMTDGPNSSFGLLADKLKNEPDMKYDFSGIIRVNCCSEPVHLELVQKFITQAKRFGMREDAFLPSYGLAENTLYATMYKSRESLCGCIGIDRKKLAMGEIEVLKRFKINTPVSSEKSDSISYYAGNGCSVVGEEILIRLDDDSFTNNPLTLGEICISGSSVSAGYWGKEIETANTFPTLADGRKILLTGDIGFVDTSGELFITGRKKEIIIINGKNYFPYDIEKTVYSASEKLVKNSCTAFSVVNNMQESLVVMQEVKTEFSCDDMTAVESDIRKAVLSEHGIVISCIVFLKEGSLKRTSSTKVRRLQSARDFETLEKIDGETARFEYINKTENSDKVPEIYCEEDVTDYLTELVSDLLNISTDAITPSSTFRNIGFDSMMMGKFSERISGQLNVEIRAHELFRYYNTELLGKYIFNSLFLKGRTDG